MKSLAVVSALVLTAIAIPASAATLTFEEALGLHRVVSYLEARDSSDPRADSEFFAKESRVWFEERKGEGRLRTGGKGPWAAWDEFFNAEKVYLSFEVEERSVAIVLLESNDFYKLIDRPAGKIRVTYDFDEEGRVVATLVEGLPTEAPRTDRLDEFRAWAARMHPEQLAFLMPDDRISPEVERARLWKTLLLEWREEIGQPIHLE